MCWSIFCIFHKFQGDSRFLHKIPGYFQGSRRQNKFQAFQGFQGAMGTLTLDPLKTANWWQIRLIFIISHFFFPINQKDVFENLEYSPLFHSNLFRPDSIDLLFLRSFSDPFERVERHKNKNEMKKEKEPKICMKIQ